MKRLIAGASVLLSGAILALAAIVAAAVGIDIRFEWRTSLGRFWSSMVDLNLMPVFVIAVIMMLAGIVLMISAARTTKHDET